MIYGLLLMLAVGSFSSWCNKEKISTTQQRVFTEEEMVWITPDGHVIPATERHHWEKYVAQRFNTKAPDRYESSLCKTEEIDCGLKCSSSRTDNCSSASACTPCMNCDCTPIASPY